MRGYTVRLKDGMRVRHDAQARFTVRSGNRTLDDRLISVEGIGGALTLAGFMYNRLTMSGGVDWWDPSTGHSIARPTVSIKLRPQDVLTGSKLCNCPRCGGTP